ncbi:MAG: aldehyde dehydrogenase family protein [Gammaproteobacteria bacterium]|nr:aldehyde dehydrogenase family protein [Gammaproteobacteria bacterium]
MSRFDVISPYTDEVIKTLEYNSAEEVEQALTRADAFFQDRSQWLAPHQRISILENVIRIMSDRIPELTRIAAQEGGKPYIDSLVEVQRAINGVKIALEHISQIKGEEIPMGITPASDNHLAYTMKEPIGVVVSVSAFNHPLNLTIHQTIPAIAVGAPVIIKPSASTPLSCLTFMEILKEAGLPDACCQVVLCQRDLAEKLVSDNRVAYLSFIGSAKVGWYLRSKLAPGAHCALEHGGAAPVIVEPDADFDSMLPALAKGGFYHAGQVCVSVQRVFVHHSIVDKVAQGLAELGKQLVVGDPLDEKTEVGPLISPKEQLRISEWVKEAIVEGAQCLSGGNVLDNNCYEPTVLLNPDLNSKVSTQEIFGPVICVYSYEHREQAIAMANQLEFAFQASVFTQNINTAIDSVKKLNASTVMVNDHTAFRVDWMPFGGRKSSGIGIGGIPYTMKEMLLDKLMVIKH